MSGTRHIIVCAFLLLVSSQVTSLANGQVRIGTDIVEGAVMIDLAEVPPGVAFLRAIALVARDAGIQRQLDRELRDWLNVVGSKLDTNVPGVLLRVNVYTNDLGNVHVPDGQLLTLIGGGKDEVDAMANYLAHDSLEVARPRGLINSSSFIWIRKGDSGLVLTTVPREFRERLMEKAIQLRDARAMAKIAQTAFPTDTVKSFAASEYWAALEKTTLERIKADDNRDRIRRLTSRMEALEREANKVYEQYRDTEREMVEAAKRQQALDTMIAVTSFVQGALESKAFSTTEGKDVTTAQSDVPFRDLPAQIQFNRLRVRQTKDDVRILEERVTIYRNQTKQLDRELENVYRGEGISLPPKR